MIREMTDHEYAQELRCRIKNLRALRTEYEAGRAGEAAAREALDGARQRRKDAYRRLADAAEAVRLMTWGTDPLAPESEPE